MVPYTRRMGSDRTRTISRHSGQRRDRVDQMIEEWAREWPDLDTSPAAIIGRLGRLTTFLDAGLEQAFRPYGLSRAGFDVLAALRRSGAPYRIPQKSLMGALMRTSGTVSFRIDRLERDGLVRREMDPTDRRNVFVSLTPEGKRLMEIVAPVHLANESRLLAALAPTERAALIELLRTLLLWFESPTIDDEAARDSVT
jgi:DNA-binding MarR family transcriptional regulator